MWIRSKKAFLTLASGVLLGAGCAKPHYLILGAAYQDDARAASKVGLTIPDVQGETPYSYVIFSVDPANAKASDYTSNDDTLSDEVKAKIAANVQMQANQQCKVGGDIDLGVAKSTVQKIKFSHEVAPLATKWIYQKAGNMCCTPNGGVTSLCKNLWVITSIYKTDASVDATTAVDLGADAQISCSSSNAAPRATGAAANATPQPAGSSADSGGSAAGPYGSAAISVRAAGSNKLNISSSGWNVVKVASLKELCSVFAR